MIFPKIFQGFSKFSTTIEKTVIFGQWKRSRTVQSLSETFGIISWFWATKKLDLRLINSTQYTYSYTAKKIGLLSIKYDLFGSDSFLSIMVILDAGKENLKMATIVSFFFITFFCLMLFFVAFSKADSVEHQLKVLQFSCYFHLIVAGWPWEKNTSFMSRHVSKRKTHKHDICVNTRTNFPYEVKIAINR